MARLQSCSPISNNSPKKGRENDRDREIAEGDQDPGRGIADEGQDREIGDGLIVIEDPELVVKRVDVGSLLCIGMCLHPDSNTSRLCSTR